MKFVIIYMKADYEPWWQFEGWEQHIVEQWNYDNEQQFHEALEQKLTQMRQKYPNERFNKEHFYAFWDEQETEYCEGCDEDTQIYHGIITQINVPV